MITYAPNSNGSLLALTRLVLQSAGQIPSLLAQLAGKSGNKLPEELTAATFHRAYGAPNLDSIESAFAIQGSDKNAHGYHLVYAPILADIGDPTAILEVGLGTNNEDVVSNMGRSGVVGASLRAFRGLAPQAQIFGADIDKRILFSEERIETFFVDQTDFRTVTSLGTRLPDSLDLVIDDGLHSPNANISILLLGIDKVANGGWIVIEDIRPESLDIWRVVGTILSHRYKSFIIASNDGAYLFCVKCEPPVTPE